jgi:hypothetical protein
MTDLPDLTVSICEIEGHTGHEARITVDGCNHVTSFCLPQKHARFLGDALGNVPGSRVAALRAEVERLRAAQLPEGTVTEWGVRFDGPPPFRSQISAYDTEAEARHQAAITPAKVGGWSATVMSRQVPPWTEVPETTTKEE